MFNFPRISFLDRTNASIIKANLIEMANNFKLELGEIHKALDSIAQCKSPFFVQHVLHDSDGGVAKSFMSEYRLDRGKLSAEASLNEYYWEQLAQQTTMHFYPDSILNSHIRWFYKKTTRYCTVEYIPFSEENVLAFYENHIIKPCSLEVAKGIVKSGRKIGIKFAESKIIVEKAITHCPELNTLISASNFVFAVLFLAHGGQEDWIEFAHKTHFALNDANKSHDLFKLTSLEDGQEGCGYIFGAELSLDYSELIASIID